MANDLMAQNDFSTGEISPNMTGLVDAEMYGNALLQCRNFMVLPTKGIQRRPGTIFELDMTDILEEGEWNDLPTYSYTIRESSQNINLFELAGQPAEMANYIFTINAGVIIGSTNTGSPAINTGAFPADSTVTLNIKENAYISGAGGRGGAGTSTGYPGGDALSLETAITINNFGTIQGGGGGGGSGTNNDLRPGGGGAGSIAGAAGGSGARAGTLTAGGAGRPQSSTYYGGDGGGPGEAGTRGRYDSVYRAGGAAGKAIVVNGNAVIWANRGAVKGAVA